jgi:hypothetical protein
MQHRPSSPRPERVAAVCCSRLASARCPTGAWTRWTLRPREARGLHRNGERPSWLRLRLCLAKWRGCAGSDAALETLRRIVHDVCHEVGMFCTRAGTVRSATANGGGQYAVCDAEAREGSAALRMEPARGDLPEAVLCLRTACKPASAVTAPRMVPEQCHSLRFSAPWARSLWPCSFIPRVLM